MLGYMEVILGPVLASQPCLSGIECASSNSGEHEVENNFETDFDFDELNYWIGHRKLECI